MIVLLILAGVTITALSGDNGILQNAAKAKEQTKKVKDDELRKLTQAEAATYLEEHEYIERIGNSYDIWKEVNESYIKKVCVVVIHIQAQMTFAEL